MEPEINLPDDSDYGSLFFENLFVCENGQPMVFAMKICPKKQELSNLIQQHGGMLLAVRSGPYTITLSADDNLLPSVYPCFKHQFIVDCVEHQRLQQLADYRIDNGAQYSPINLQQVLMGLKKWGDIQPLPSAPKQRPPAEARPASPSSSSSDEELNEFLNRPRFTKQRFRQRREYTHDDRVAIMTYILDHCLLGEVGGRTMWQDMARKQVIGPSRTWQSIKEHFRRQVVPHHLSQLGLTDKQMRTVLSKFPEAIKNYPNLSWTSSKSSKASQPSEPFKNYNGQRRENNVPGPSGIQGGVALRSSADMHATQRLPRETNLPGTSGVQFATTSTSSTASGIVGTKASNFSTDRNDIVSPNKSKVCSGRFCVDRPSTQASSLTGALIPSQYVSNKNGSMSSERACHAFSDSFDQAENWGDESEEGTQEFSQSLLPNQTTCISFQSNVTNAQEPSLHARHLQDCNHDTPLHPPVNRSLEPRSSPMKKTPLKPLSELQKGDAAATILPSAVSAEKLIPKSTKGKPEHLLTGQTNEVGSNGPEEEQNYQEAEMTRRLSARQRLLCGDQATGGPSGDQSSPAATGNAATSTSQIPSQQRTLVLDNKENDHQNKMERQQCKEGHQKENCLKSPENKHCKESPEEISEEHSIEIVKVVGISLTDSCEVVSSQDSHMINSSNTKLSKGDSSHVDGISIADNELDPQHDNFSSKPNVGSSVRDDFTLSECDSALVVPNASEEDRVTSSQDMATPLLTDKGSQDYISASEEVSSSQDSVGPVLTGASASSDSVGPVLTGASAFPENVSSSRDGVTSRLGALHNSDGNVPNKQSTEKSRENNVPHNRHSTRNTRDDNVPYRPSTENRHEDNVPYSLNTENSEDKSVYELGTENNPEDCIPKSLTSVTNPLIPIIHPQEGYHQFLQSIVDSNGRAPESEDQRQSFQIGQQQIPAFNDPDVSTAGEDGRVTTRFENGRLGPVDIVRGHRSNEDTYDEQRQPHDREHRPLEDTPPSRCTQLDSFKPPKVRARSSSPIQLPPDKSPRWHTVTSLDRIAAADRKEEDSLEDSSIVPESESLTLALWEISSNDSSHRVPMPDLDNLSIFEDELEGNSATSEEYVLRDSCMKYNTGRMLPLSEEEDGREDAVGVNSEDEGAMEESVEEVQRDAASYQSRSVSQLKKTNESNTNVPRCDETDTDALEEESFLSTSKSSEYPSTPQSSEKASSDSNSRGSAPSSSSRDSVLATRKRKERGTGIGAGKDQTNDSEGGSSCIEVDGPCSEQAGSSGDTQSMTPGIVNTYGTRRLTGKRLAALPGISLEIACAAADTGSKVTSGVATAVEGTSSSGVATAADGVCNIATSSSWVMSVASCSVVRLSYGLPLDSPTCEPDNEDQSSRGRPLVTNLSADGGEDIDQLSGSLAKRFKADQSQDADVVGSKEDPKNTAAETTLRRDATVPVTRSNECTVPATRNSNDTLLDAVITTSAGRSHSRAKELRVTLTRSKIDGDRPLGKHSACSRASDSMTERVDEEYHKQRFLKEISLTLHPQKSVIDSRSSEGPLHPSSTAGTSSPLPVIPTTTSVSVPSACTDVRSTVKRKNVSTSSFESPSKRTSGTEASVKFIGTVKQKTASALFQLPSKPPQLRRLSGDFTIIDAPAAAPTTSAATTGIPVSDGRRGSGQNIATSGDMDDLNEVKDEEKGVTWRPPYRGKPPLANRRAYTTEERVAMVTYILDHDLAEQTTGISIWRQMAHSKVIKGGHTWQSIKEHFRRQVLPHHLSELGLTEYQMRTLLSRYPQYLKKYNLASNVEAATQTSPASLRTSCGVSCSPIRAEGALAAPIIGPDTSTPAAGGRVPCYAAQGTSGSVDKQRNAADSAPSHSGNSTDHLRGAPNAARGASTSKPFDCEGDDSTDQEDDDEHVPQVLRSARHKRRYSTVTRRTAAVSDHNNLLQDSDDDLHFEEDEESSEEEGNRRRPYSLEEDMFILRFLLDTKRWREVGGRVVWTSMQSSVAGLRQRSWHSLKERYRKVLVKRLGKYRLTAQERACLRGDGTGAQTRNSSNRGRRATGPGYPVPRQRKRDQEDELQESEEESDEQNKHEDAEQQKQKRLFFRSSRRASNAVDVSGGERPSGRTRESGRRKRALLPTLDDALYEVTPRPAGEEW